MVETQFHKPMSPRPRHPSLPELTSGAALNVGELRKRPDAKELQPLIELLANAEYWLSFDLAAFEPLASRCPSPLRELAVGIALRFGEGLDGSLGVQDIQRFKEVMLPKIPADLQGGVLAGLARIERSIELRDSVPTLTNDGFQPYTATGGVAVHALMGGGRIKLGIEGAEAKAGGFECSIGTTIRLFATDERGRPMEAPEIESELEAPILSKSDSPTSRVVILLVPGRYRIRVSGRVESKTLVAK